MTTEQRLKVLLQAPWTVQVAPAKEQGNIVLRIKELPEFLVVGPRTDNLDAEFWTALESLLEDYLADGEEPPLPAGFQPHWTRASAGYPRQVLTGAGTVSQSHSGGNEGAKGEQVEIVQPGRRLAVAAG
jgi:hypothetical protein